MTTAVPGRAIRHAVAVLVLTLAACAGLTLSHAAAAHAGQEDCKDYAYSCTPGYTGSNAQSTWAWRYYGGSYAATNTGYHNCTLYAAWRLAENGVGDPGHSWGNAYQWAGAIGGGNHTPAVGSIAWWGTEVGGGDGHVAYVEQVSGSSVFIRADNYSTTNGYTSSGWIPASSVDLFLHPHDLPTNNAPVGSFDSATSPSPGVIHVTGWAFDPDSPTGPIHVHVYVGGPAGSGAPGYDLGPTSAARSDVQNVYPQAGPTTGFDTSAPSDGGSIAVYAYGIDSAGGANTLLGTKTVAVANPNPEGSFDVAATAGRGLAHVSGWAFDPSDPRTRAHVHVYVGGPAGSGAPAYDLGPTWQTRPDVQKAVAGAGDHTGFDAVVPAPAGSVTFFVYGINVGNGSTNPLLGTKTVQIAAGPSTWPAPRAGAPRVTSASRKMIRLAWGSWGGRPSGETFDVAYRFRTSRKGASWGGWHAWRAGTTDRSGSVPVAGRRYYCFRVRVHTDVIGRGPSMWSVSRQRLVR